MKEKQKIRDILKLHHFNAKVRSLAASTQTAPHLDVCELMCQACFCTRYPDAILTSTFQQLFGQLIQQAGI